MPPLPTFMNSMTGCWLTSCFNRSCRLGAPCALASSDLSSPDSCGSQLKTVVCCCYWPRRAKSVRRLSCCCHAAVEARRPGAGSQRGCLLDGLLHAAPTSQQATARPAPHAPSSWHRCAAACPTATLAQQQPSSHSPCLHLQHNVAAAQQLAVHVELRVGGPLRQLLHNDVEGWRCKMIVTTCSGAGRWAAASARARQGAVGSRLT